MPGSPCTCRSSSASRAKSIRFCSWSDSASAASFTSSPSAAEVPIVDWLRAYGREIFATNGGKGIGVIGLCLTGNFAIALLADAFTLAPVAGEPSLPFGITAAARASMAVNDDDLARAQARNKGRRPIDVFAFLQRQHQSAGAVRRDCGGVRGEFQRYRNPLARCRMGYSSHRACGPDGEFLRHRRAPDAPCTRPRCCVPKGAARLTAAICAARNATSGFRFRP